MRVRDGLRSSRRNVLLLFKFAGEQTVKNIAKPVRAYHVVMDSTAARRRRLPMRPLKVVSGWVILADHRQTTSSGFRKTISPRVTIALGFPLALTSGAVVSIWYLAPRKAPQPRCDARRFISQVRRPAPAFHNYALYQTPWFALSLDGLLDYTPQGSTGPLLARRLDA